MRPTANKSKRLVRRYPRSGIDAFGRWACTHDWYSELGKTPSVDDLASSFSSHVTSAINITLPLKVVRFHYSDKPWITSSIKQLINERQKAFHCGNHHLWHQLKYKVQNEITLRKKRYYADKVQHLRKDDSRKWWMAVNQMSGRSARNSSIRLERDGQTLSDQVLVNTLNSFFVSVNADIPQLDLSALPSYLPAPDKPPTIQTHDVCKKLLTLRPFKACGPDNIPSRLLKEFAYEFAQPVTTIFNTSILSGICPSIWKDSNISPIPKIPQPSCEGDIRPISLTACLSKVLEDFVVNWMISDVGDKIDTQQFGCLKGTSTTYCLLDMIHNWLSHLDPSGHHLRLLFLDFSKAFDRIGHNVLIQKLIDIGVRRSLIPWVANFLSNRRQCTKLGEFISPWLPVTAGVPQGTKLGPVLFLIMVNDLKITSPGDTGIWKYVDDISISESISRDSMSSIQTHLDGITSWAEANWMKLNVKKCKEMRICFLKNQQSFNPLQNDGQTLEIVSSHKVLGVIIQDNLKWNEHIIMTVKKSSKRLHILRTLRRGGIPPHDLSLIYYALVRSVLEYCCIVWHNNLPAYLSDAIERVQKRAFKILLPEKSYSEALVELKCPRLKDRRDILCEKTIKKIASGGRLSHLLPAIRESVHNYDLRNKSNRTLFKCRTSRLKNSFFPSMVPILNNLK